MTHQADLAFEVGIPCFEEFENAVTFIVNNPCYVALICRALIEENVESKVSNQTSEDIVDSDIINGRVFFFFLLMSVAYILSVLGLYEVM